MDSLLPQAFDIDLSDINESLDNPKTGEDYLKNVIFERHFCPDTVTAQLDVEKFNNKQNVFIMELPTKPISPSDSFLPTAEWQTLQEADFSEVRCNISRLYNSKEEWRHKIKLPSIYDDNSTELWRNFMDSHLPQLSLVFTMRQQVLEYILDNIIESLDTVPPGEGLPRRCGLWLYAVLASLKLPLTPEVCSSLRELARKCQSIRSKLEIQEEDPEPIVTPLNLFICLVARYFRQEDFTD